MFTTNSLALPFSCAWCVSKWFWLNAYAQIRCITITSIAQYDSWQFKYLPQKKIDATTDKTKYILEKLQFGYSVTILESLHVDLIHRNAYENKVLCAHNQQEFCASLTAWRTCFYFSVFFDSSRLTHRKTFENFLKDVDIKFVPLFDSCFFFSSLLFFFFICHQFAEQSRVSRTRKSTELAQQTEKKFTPGNCNCRKMCMPRCMQWKGWLCVPINAGTCMIITPSIAATNSEWKVQISTEVVVFPFPFFFL